MTHHQEKNPSTETAPEMTWMIVSVEHNVKPAIIYFTSSRK